MAENIGVISIQKVFKIMRLDKITMELKKKWELVDLWCTWKKKRN